MTRILPAVARATNILILDIERLPGLAEVWDQKTGFVPHHKFQRLPATICFAARRYGQPGQEFWADWDQGHEAMVRRSWELYDQADIVVTYNGIGFDNKHLRTDWELAGLGEPSPWKGCRPVPGQQEPRPRLLLHAARRPGPGHRRQGRPLRRTDGGRCPSR